MNELRTSADHPIEVDDVEYGAWLECAVAEWGGEFLEAALLAGHLPHPDGILLSLRGTQIRAMREVESRVSRDVLGDALGRAGDYADFFREVQRLPQALSRTLDLRVASFYNDALPTTYTTGAAQDAWMHAAVARVNRAAVRQARREDAIAAYAAKRRGLVTGGAA